MTMQNALLTIPICNCYKKNNQGVHCAHPENTHTPPTEGIGILKKCVKLYWNFQRGGGGGGS